MRIAFAFLVIMLLPICALADAAKGKEIFTQRCASCHGNEGKGDGPVAAGLPPAMKPRNLAEKAGYKFATDDAKLKDVILKGGVPFGLNALMAPQSGLSDADLASLIEFVKSLQH